jgi:hypothetical protein
VVNLDALRIELRRKNLHDTPKRVDLAPLQPYQSGLSNARSADGSYNDLGQPDMGRAGMHFGRNVPLKQGYPDEAALMDPNPREISARLLARKEFVPATGLNMLAAAWIQFQVHGWLNHERSRSEFHEVPVPAGDDWPDSHIRVGKTRQSTPATEQEPPAYVNTESHWWDQSQLYGSSEERQRRLRAATGGKLSVEAVQIGGRPDQRLPVNPDTGFTDLTGFDDNYWVGLSLLHTLFVLEHNAICDHLGRHYPAWDDNQLFNTARLINCALIAKIHTVEWTPGIVGHPALTISMNANWWGLLGERIRRSLGRLSETEELSGIMGSETNHHSGAYAMTEEFTAVYRLHPLIPDLLAFYSARDGGHRFDKGFTDVQGKHTRAAMQDLEIGDFLYSFGITNPGAIRLHNYPNTLRRFARADPATPPIDLAAVDILRDRERGVPRYNQFRQALHKKPVRNFSDITSNKVWAKEIAEAYGGDIDKVDTLVGLLAEDVPQGFGFSDTAFRIFILMASRRLKSDRFFTRDYRPEVYTQLGLDWIDENGMASVVIRHFPHLAPAVQGVGNPFAPWNKLTRCN